MFSLFKKEKENEKDGSHLSLISVAALLIHSAKIDENFTEKEKLIIKKALIEMGADHKNIDEIINAEKIARPPIRGLGFICCFLLFGSSYNLFLIEKFFTFLISK